MSLSSISRQTSPRLPPELHIVRRLTIPQHVSRDHGVLVATPEVRPVVVLRRLVVVEARVDQNCRAPDIVVRDAYKKGGVGGSHGGPAGEVARALHSSRWLTPCRSTTLPFWLAVQFAQRPRDDVKGPQVKAYGLMRRRMPVTGGSEGCVARGGQSYGNRRSTH